MRFVLAVVVLGPLVAVVALGLALAPQLEEGPR